MEEKEAAKLAERFKNILVQIDDHALERSLEYLVDALYESTSLNIIAKSIEIGLITADRSDLLLTPKRIFSQSPNLAEHIRVRIDDKLGQIANFRYDQEDSVTDLIGLLIALRVVQQGPG